MLHIENKGKGDLHLCVDYHASNINTMIDAWPLPHINDLLSQLKGARFFNSLDLCDSY